LMGSSALAGAGGGAIGCVASGGGRESDDGLGGGGGGLGGGGEVAQCGVVVSWAAVGYAAIAVMAVRLARGACCC
jgi:hypothetical protein